MVTGPLTVDALVSDDRVSSVLVATPPHHDAAAETCSSATAIAPPGDLATIAVTPSKTPDEWLDAHRSCVGTLPAHVSLVDVGADIRSAASDGGQPTPVPNGPVGSIRTVQSPGSLTQLGLRITEALDEISALESDLALSLCFDSLSPLLVHAEPETVFKFLTVLTGEVSADDGFGHYHIDPGAHEAATVQTLTTVFDAVIRADGDDVVVETR
jgi:hypothetical protein